MRRMMLMTALAAWASSAAAADGAFRVAETAWTQVPDGRHFGSHRAVVRVDAAASAVCAHLPWRRPDRDPAGVDVRVVARADGKPVERHQVLSADNESGTVAFGPVAPGEYEIYYFPYDWPNPALGKPTTRHIAPAPDPALRKAWGNPGALPQATFLYFEARTPHDAFYPMEVIATRAEVAALAARAPESFWLFPEARTRPVRMRRFLPEVWVAEGPKDAFADMARPNEYFTWQLAVHARQGDLAVTRVEFSDLTGPDGAVLPAAAQTCFNVSGRDYRGKPFTQPMPVAKGETGALWCGVDVPADAAPGVYRGTATVHTAGHGARDIAFTLTVEGDVLTDRGDAESWRMSRLRWLNSALGLEDEALPGFANVVRDGNVFTLPDRRIVLGDDGFPASIAVKGKEILAAPVRFAFTHERGREPLAPRAASMAFGEEGKTFSTWTFTAAYPAFDVTGDARLEMDGMLEYRVTVKARAATGFRDMALEVRQTPEHSTYLSGLDLLGGYAPAEHTWRWGYAPNSHSNNQWWAGVPDGGLWGKLMDAHDTWMEGAIQAIGAARQDHYPPAWHNEGKGGVAWTKTADGGAVRAFSGPRRLAAGEETAFRFALLVTPARTPDPAHFGQRYYTRDQPPAAVAKQKGATILTLFHGHPALACINYPFASLKALDAALADAKAQGIRTSGYHTTGQVSTEMAELWAFRALPDDPRLFPGGDEDREGFYWDMEHLGDRFKAGWLACLHNGVWDSSIATGGTSRYQNYYVESLRWLIDRGLGGLYLDGFGSDRVAARRIRRALKSVDPEAPIDLHLGNARVPWHGGLKLSEMCRNAENIVYFDTTWAGESYDFDMPPDQWLTEASGLIYGVYGDMLNDPNTKPNLWRGMLYGMATRYYTFVPAAETGLWSRTNWSDPAPVWKLWDDFGIADAELVGYWRDDCPVKTGRDDILASVYAKEDAALVVLGSWSGRSGGAKRAVMGGDGAPARLRWFTPLGEKDARDLGTEAALSYDDEALRLDYRAKTRGRPRLRIPAGGKGPIWEDDSLELYLEVKPNPWRTRLIQIVVNGNGAWRARDVEDPAFSPACDVRAEKPTRAGWGGTVTIPWAELGLDAPHPGTEFPFNLARNLAIGDAVEYHTWSPGSGSYANRRCFGRLVAGGEAATTETGEKPAAVERPARDRVRLSVDWGRLGFDPETHGWYQPEMAGMQPEAHPATDAAFEIEVDKGLFLLLRPQ